MTQTTKSTKRQKPVGAVRLKHKHYGLDVYETPDGSVFAVGTPTEIDRAVDEYIRDQLIHKARSELLFRYQPGVDIDAFVRAKSLGELDVAIARLMRWVIAPDPARYLRGLGEISALRQARAEGLNLPADVRAMQLSGRVVGR